MTQTIAANVSDTAHWVAVYRAMETARRDALFRDHLASKFAGETGKALAASAPRRMRNGWPVIIRTKIIDDMVQAAIANGCDCVLNLAAGLDARPYRLNLPHSLTWIEADLPGLVDKKSALVVGETPRCNLVREKIDLTDAGARARFLNSALSGRRKAFVLTEGLLMYLRDEDVVSLAHDLARPEVKWWAFDLISPTARDVIMKDMRQTLANAPMHFAPADGVAFFERLGWQVDELQPSFDAAMAMGRLPWHLHLLGLLRRRRSDPRNLSQGLWSAVVRLVKA